ncbi:hypothetical protein O181_104115 [Austropuccinia psidii MF-1]|uniref:Peptidase A2 domain-containing protein n=1 Tax=Austropuccinia psidii MF-1 TaxID=1389203 RepID=A0A9Q3JMV7_9BASI|nr:hypothetical protein [Austropuccinia psidii MF-1]
MALVETGSEINIIPQELPIKASLTSRKLNMSLRAIGGPTISFVGLSEFTPITMIKGEEKEIHLFIEKGAVHTILARPFLADNNIKLEFSHKQGEYLVIQRKMEEDYFSQYVTPKLWIGKFLNQEEQSFGPLQKLENGQWIKNNHLK